MCYYPGHWCNGDTQEPLFTFLSVSPGLGSGDTCPLCFPVVQPLRTEACVPRSWLVEDMNSSLLALWCGLCSLRMLPAPWSGTRQWREQSRSNEETVALAWHCHLQLGPRWYQGLE